MTTQLDFALATIEEYRAEARSLRSELSVARDALREIMVTARDLTAGRSDDAVLVEVADIAASALLAPEVSPE
jgi:hypothetical protein